MKMIVGGISSVLQSLTSKSMLNWCCDFEIGWDRSEDFVVVPLEDGIHPAKKWYREVWAIGVCLPGAAFCVGYYDRVEEHLIDNFRGSSGSCESVVC